MMIVVGREYVKMKINDVDDLLFLNNVEFNGFMKIFIFGCKQKKSGCDSHLLRLMKIDNLRT